MLWRLVPVLVVRVLSTGTLVRPKSNDLMFAVDVPTLRYRMSVSSENRSYRTSPASAAAKWSFGM